VTQNNAEAHAWQVWLEGAPLELKEEFGGRSGAAVARVRRRYPAFCDVRSAEYQRLKEECSDELDELALDIQEMNEDAID